MLSPLFIAAWKDLQVAAKVNLGIDLSETTARQMVQNIFAALKE